MTAAEFSDMMREAWADHEAGRAVDLDALRAARDSVTEENPSAESLYMLAQEIEGEGA